MNLNVLDPNTMTTSERGKEGIRTRTAPGGPDMVVVDKKESVREEGLK